jgi:hypothetical protein
MLAQRRSSEGLKPGPAERSRSVWQSSSKSKKYQSTLLARATEGRTPSFVAYVASILVQGKIS